MKNKAKKLPKSNSVEQITSQLDDVAVAENDSKQTRPCESVTMDESLRKPNVIYLCRGVVRERQTVTEKVEKTICLALPSTSKGREADEKRREAEAAAPKPQPPKPELSLAEEFKDFKVVKVKRKFSTRKIRRV